MNKVKVPRLTNRLLEAIIDMGTMIEAGGTDSMDGRESEREREIAFEAAMDAMGWAQAMLRRRRERARAK